MHVPKAQIAQEFRAIGWGAVHVVETGYQFGVCPWLGVRRIPKIWADLPDVAQLAQHGAVGWTLYGTLSPGRSTKAGFRKIGDRAVTGPFPPLPPGHTGPLGVVVNDIALTSKLR